MQSLNLETADKIASTCVAVAQRNNFAPCTITVLDNNGDILVQKRMDGCPSKGIPEFSHAKANTCAVFKMHSRWFREFFTEGNDPSKVCI